MAKLDITISGDVAGLLTLSKQLQFSAFRTTNDLLDRAQENIPRALKRGLHIRGNWMTPRTKFGVNVRYAKRGTMEGSVGTAADWLLEEEGFNDGVKKVDKPNKGSSTNLAIPDVGNARPTLMAKMPPSQKAGKLLANTKRTKAFKVRSKRSGKWLVLQRVGETASGQLLRDSRGNLRIGRKKERARTRVVLKAVLQPRIKVPETQIFTKTGVKTMNANHFVDRLGKNLRIALKTARK